MTVMIAIPGAEELVGNGVYHGLPDTIPQPVRDGHAVVVGAPADCAAAARRLVHGGWTVTIVSRERGGRGRVAAEVVCATGIEHLEALVLRRIDSGRIEGCNASALFIL